MRLTARLAALVAVLVLAATSLAGAAPQIEITTPAAWDTISRSATAAMTLAGTAAFEDPVADQRKFFLRRSQCASGNDDARLDIRKGTGEQTGCAFIAQPANEVLAQQGDPLSTTYPAAAGMPLTLDATKPIKGVLAVSGGVGQGVVEITLSGVTAADELVDLGKFTDTRVVSGLSTVEIAWEIQPDASLDRVDFADLSLNVLVRGVAPNYGAIRHNGLSHFTVPTWSASFSRTVEYAIDSPSFSPTAKRAATLSADGLTWSATPPTPAVGNHTVYARAVQGLVVTNATPVAFTVTE